MQIRDDIPVEEAGERFETWVRELERRHLADLTFQEVRRGIQALSTAYVHKRGDRIADALAGAGKRAGFALFYGPLHFLTVQAAVRGLDVGPVERIVDLGCGTGVAGAAWALEMAGNVPVTGIERHSWAAREARWTYRKLGIRGTVRTMDLDRVELPGSKAGIILAFTLNELEPAARERLRRRLLDAARPSAALLVVEPIARRIAPWWEDWTGAFLDAGGRTDEWRVSRNLPPSLRLLDKAAGLDHQEITARSLWVPGEQEQVRPVPLR